MVMLALFYALLVPVISWTVTQIGSASITEPANIELSRSLAPKKASKSKPQAKQKSQPASRKHPRADRQDQPTGSSPIHDEGEELYEDSDSDD